MDVFIFVGKNIWKTMTFTSLKCKHVYECIGRIRLGYPGIRIISG